MRELTVPEKGAFLGLFKRGGYVLNFSTNDFDIFTMESVGVPLCDRYQMSKGKSLTEYVTSESPENVYKLLRDLFIYYQSHYEHEYQDPEPNASLISGYNDERYADLYKKCLRVINEIDNANVPLNETALQLKEEFSSEYLSNQIESMLKMQSENPTEAIGKAKELIESCCKTILDKSGVGYEIKWDINKLTGETLKLLHLMPSNIPDTAKAAVEIKAILGNLRAISNNLAALRNPYGSGHGKSANYKGLSERHAKLAVGCSITLVSFLWDTFKARQE